MTDFQAWNHTSHPIVRLEDDWNSLLDHGLRTRYGCIVWKNSSSYYEATNLATGLIVYGGADNVGSVDGTDVSAVCDAVVDTGGYQYLFIASQGTTITWERDNIPANTIVEGDNPYYVVIKEQDDADANYVTLSHGACIINCSIWDKAGNDQGLGANAARPVHMHYNARASTTVNSSSWTNQTIVVDSGEAATDNPGIAVNQFGIGDGFYASSDATNGVCYRASVNETTSANHAFGFYASNWGGANSAAFVAIGKAGSSGDLYYCSPEADCKSFTSEPTVATTTDINVESATKTTGQMVNLYHKTSTFGGDGILMNFADTAGTFNGKYIEYKNNTTTVGYVASTGRHYITPASNTEGVIVYPSVDTTSDITVQTASKTAGQFLNAYHNTSAFTGDVLMLNIADGSGSFASGSFITGKVNTATKFLVAYSGQGNFTVDGVCTLVNAGAVSDATTTEDTNGCMAIDSSNGRFYFRYGGGWHYCSQDAGVQVRADELVCVHCGEAMVEGQHLSLLANRTMSDGALHADYVHLRCALRVEGW